MTPVITAAGRMPEPVLHVGRTIITRPRQVVEYLLAQPTILDPQDVTGIAQRFTACPVP